LVSVKNRTRVQDANDAGVIEQKTFNTGNEYFTMLKSISSRYMHSKGFKFSSNDSAALGYLTHALRDRVRSGTCTRSLKSAFV